MASKHGAFGLRVGTVDSSGKQPKTAFADVAASQTDSEIVAAVSGKHIRVLAYVIQCGGTATTIVFNTASTAITPSFANAANGGSVVPFNPVGWFETNEGEALTVTTGAGSATGVLVRYVEVDPA